jgi:hypothetical protein
MDYIVKSLAELDAVGSAALSTGMRNKKIRDYSIGELGSVISEGVGLAYLVPVAMLNLIAQPFANDGELLVSVLAVEEGFWEEHPMYVASVKRLCRVVKGRVNEVGMGEEVKVRIMEMVERWG